MEAMKTDKMKLESDLADTRYELEVAIRKLGLLNKKVCVIIVPRVSMALPNSPSIRPWNHAKLISKLINQGRNFTGAVFCK